MAQTATPAAALPHAEEFNRPRARLMLRMPRAESQTTGALVDLVLLFFAIGTAADMMINFGSLFTIFWLFCYALALLRIAAAWPWFLAMLSRNVTVLVYPTICIASVLWSYSPAGTLVSALQLAMTVLIGCYLGWRYSLAILLKCFAILMSVAAVLSLIHLAAGIFPWPAHVGGGGLAGLFKHKTMLGQRSLFAITILTALFLLRKGEVGWTPRLLLVVAMAMTLIALILSRSMTSVLLLAPMAGIVLLLCHRRIPALGLVGGLSIVILASAVGPVWLSVAGIDPVHALLDGVGKDATLTGRTDLWNIAESVRERHPYFGTGFRAFWIAPEFTNGRALTYAAGARNVASFHNFVMEILVSVGWPGLLAMLAGIVVCGQRLASLFARDRLPTTAAAISILGGIVLTSLMETSLFRGHEIMILLLAAMTVAAGEELRRPVDRASALVSTTQLQFRRRYGAGGQGPVPSQNTEQ